MIDKISHYFSKSNGHIRIVTVIQIIRQRPPSKPKRKRRPLSIGDASDARRGALPPLTANTNDPVTADEPILPQLPPPGRFTQGFYRVYKHGLNAANKRVIQCPIKHQVSSYSLSPARKLIGVGVLHHPIRQYAHTHLGYYPHYGPTAAFCQVSRRPVCYST